MKSITELIAMLSSEHDYVCTEFLYKNISYIIKKNSRKKSIATVGDFLPHMDYLYLMLAYFFSFLSFGRIFDIEKKLDCYP